MKPHPNDRIVEEIRSYLANLQKRESARRKGELEPCSNHNHNSLPLILSYARTLVGSERTDDRVLALNIFIQSQDVSGILSVIDVVPPFHGIQAYGELLRLVVKRKDKDFYAEKLISCKYAFQKEKSRLEEQDALACQYTVTGEDGEKETCLDRRGKKWLDEKRIAATYEELPIVRDVFKESAALFSEGVIKTRLESMVADLDRILRFRDQNPLRPDTIKKKAANFICRLDES